MHLRQIETLPIAKELWQTSPIHGAASTPPMEGHANAIRTEGIGIWMSCWV